MSNGINPDLKKAREDCDSLRADLAEMHEFLNDYGLALS